MLKGQDSSVFDVKIGTDKPWNEISESFAVLVAIIFVLVLINLIASGADQNNRGCAA